MSSSTGTDNDPDRAVTAINDLAGTPLVNKIAMPATSEEVIPVRDNEERPNITSRDNMHSYCHAISVSEVIELTKRLDLHDEKEVTTPVDIDIRECTHDDKALMSDSEPVDIQQDEAASPLHIAFAEDAPSKTDLSTTLSAKSSANIATESDNASLASTEPVPTIYPPRRPNIFSKRAPQRNVRFSPAVLAETSHAVEDAENDGDGFTPEEFQEFQSKNKEGMEKKTARFMSMVSQYSWRPRVVEDLGEAFALDD